MALNGLTVTANGLATEKPFLPRVIEFVKAQALSGSQEAKAKARNEDDEPPEPEYFLYPPDRLRKLFGETSPRRVGRGLQNLGNTCYFNSVLQALTYAVPLQKYFLTKEHSTSCMAKQHGTVCTLCLFEQHVLSVFDAQKGAFKPLDLLRHLPQIARRFHSRGRQEDAHEFLIHFLDSCLGVLSRTSFWKSLGLWCCVFHWPPDRCHKSFLKHATADASVSRSAGNSLGSAQLFCAVSAMTC